MAKIIKIGSQNLTPNKIANPFKTSRNSTTNPFKYSNFEGNTLKFADVFEGFTPKSTSKLRMIASSVTGSMNKMRSSITEPIVNFVNRVRGGVSQAWNYANSTSFSAAMSDAMMAINETPAIKHMNEVLNTPINIPALDGLSQQLSGIREGISSKLSSKVDFLNRDVLDIGKDMSAKWNALVSKIHTRRINSSMSVEELENLWKEEIALGGVA